MAGVADRKPANVNFETWVDAQIRAARERGEFDNLPGHGKPLPNLDIYADDLWWIRQLLKREELSFTPPALALRKSVEDLLDSVGRLRSEQAVRDVVEELDGRIRHMNRIPPVDGPPSNLMPLDVERVVARCTSSVRPTRQQRKRLGGQTQRMPRRHQVRRSERDSPIVHDMYDCVFGGRDPVDEPGTETGSRATGGRRSRIRPTCSNTRSPGSASTANTGP